METSVEEIMALVASGGLNPKAAAKLIQDKLDEARTNLEKKLQSDINKFLSDRLKYEYEAELSNLKNNMQWEEYVHSLDFKLHMFHLKHALQERKRLPRSYWKQYWEIVVFEELEQLIKIYMGHSGKT
jgi:polyhydroxyalkanoate synthesis regulator phasin